MIYNMSFFRFIDWIVSYLQMGRRPLQQASNLSQSTRCGWRGSDGLSFSSRQLTRTQVRTGCLFWLVLVWLSYPPPPRRHRVWPAGWLHVYGERNYEPQPELCKRNHWRYCHNMTGPFRNPRFPSINRAARSAVALDMISVPGTPHSDRRSSGFHDYNANRRESTSSGRRTHCKNGPFWFCCCKNGPFRLVLLTLSKVTFQTQQKYRPLSRLLPHPPWAPSLVSLPSLTTDLPPDAFLPPSLAKYRPRAQSSGAMSAQSGGLPAHLQLKKAPLRFRHVGVLFPVVGGILQLSDADWNAET